MTEPWIPMLPVFAWVSNDYFSSFKVFWKNSEEKAGLQVIHGPWKCPLTIFSITVIHFLRTNLKICSPGSIVVIMNNGWIYFFEAPFSTSKDLLRIMLFFTKAQPKCNTISFKAYCQGDQQQPQPHDLYSSTK